MPVPRRPAISSRPSPLLRRLGPSHCPAATRLRVAFAALLTWRTTRQRWLGAGLPITTIVRRTAQLVAQHGRQAYNSVNCDTTSSVKLARITVDSALRQLRNQVASTSCRELCRVLTSLGYALRVCGSAGHRVFRHPQLPNWEGSHFNCGHRETEDVRPRYVRRIITAIESHADELRRLRGEKSDA